MVTAAYDACHNSCDFNQLCIDALNTWAMLKASATSGDIDRAVRASALAPLSSRTLNELLRGSVVHHCSAMAVVGQRGDEAVMGLVIAGLLRSYVATSDGWQVTVRYSRRGGIFGLLALAGRDELTGTQAIRESVVLALDGPNVAQIASRDAHVAWLLAREAVRRLGHAYQELVFQARAPLYARLARELLARSPHREDAAALEIAVHQDELAESIGSAREVVGRTLSSMRRDGLIRTRPGHIIVLDPERLRRTYRGDPS